MKFRQGKAPAILYRDGRKLWEFTAGYMEMDFDPDIYALLLQRGAECEEPAPTVSAEEPAGPKLPEPKSPEPTPLPRKRHRT